jgi:hypothetical protein
MTENQVNNMENQPKLMQFIRGKGKRVPKMENGEPVRDAKGKIVMVREKGLPRGILVADEVGREVRIGWSYVNKRVDNFDKEIGMRIAMGRMSTPSNERIIPHAVLKEIIPFSDRVQKYFKITV